MVCAGGAGGASNTHCKAPKGTHGPIKGLKAGYATSCATALKVAKGWDDKCGPSIELCGVSVAGNRWSCRIIPANSHDLYVRCGLQKTTRGRPVVNFHQSGAVHG